MWNNLVFDCYNYTLTNTSFNNQKSFILVYLLKWQYFWWFWFSYFFIYYYKFSFNKPITQLFKFNPKIITSKKSHGKWGDVIICFLPIFWCVNILTNSNVLLKTIEWQTESYSVLLRVRAKQWYWSYKFKPSDITKLLDQNIIIGSGKSITKPKELYNEKFMNVLEQKIHYRKTKLTVKYKKGLAFFKHDKKTPKKIRTSNSLFNLSRRNIKELKSMYTRRSNIIVNKEKKLKQIEEAATKNILKKVFFKKCNKLKSFNQRNYESTIFQAPKTLPKMPKNSNIKTIFNIIDKSSFTLKRPQRSNVAERHVFNFISNPNKDYIGSINDLYHFVNLKYPFNQVNRYKLFSPHLCFLEKFNFKNIAYKKTLLWNTSETGIQKLVLRKNPLKSETLLKFMIEEKPKESYRRYFMTLKQEIRKDPYEVKNFSEKYYATVPEFESIHDAKKKLRGGMYKFHESLNLIQNRRLLDTETVLVLPTFTNLTIVTNSFDVVHSWFIPGLGLKMDCVPGRSTHHSLFVESTGFYYGQCAEICGRLHHHMPIKVCFVPLDYFLIWWNHFSYRHSDFLVPQTHFNS